MSGSHTLSKAIGISEFYELVSDVKDKIVNSDDESEIAFCGQLMEPEQHGPDSNSNSALKLEEINRNTFQIETPSIGDEVDIKYEVTETEQDSTTEFDTEAILTKINSTPLNHHSNNSEETELNQLYLDLFQCDQNCETCQKYIRKLSEHVRGTHVVDQPTRDPLLIDPLDTDKSPTVRIKCEVDEEVGRIDLPEEPDSSSESDVRSDGDLDYKASPELTLKRGRNHKQVKSSWKDEVFETEIPDGQNPFKCEKCGKAFAKKYRLNYHMKIHAPEKPYKCAECEKRFTTKSQLNDHLRIHTGEKPFTCERCGKSFSKKSSLTLHMMIHTGVRPFKCQECDQSFKTSFEFTAHKMSHSGGRAFQCEECEKSFTRKSHLLSHLRIHSGEKPFNCELCPSSFRTKIQLTIHCEGHGQERPYKCDMCEKDFKRPSALRRHKIKNYHNNA